MRVPRVRNQSFDGRRTAQKMALIVLNYSIEVRLPYPFVLSLVINMMVMKTMIECLANGRYLFNEQIYSIKT